VPDLIGDIVAMLDGWLARIFWRVVDALDYFVTLMRLRILDMLAGPEPETSADQQRGGSGADSKSVPQARRWGSWRPGLRSHGSRPERRLIVRGCESSDLHGGPDMLRLMDQPEETPTLPA
jgi:hypothetical protein